MPRRTCSRTLTPATTPRRNAEAPFAPRASSEVGPGSLPRGRAVWSPSVSPTLATDHADQRPIRIATKRHKNPVASATISRAPIGARTFASALQPLRLFAAPLSLHSVPPFLICVDLCLPAVGRPKAGPSVVSKNWWFGLLIHSRVRRASRVGAAVYAVRVFQSSNLPIFRSSNLPIFRFPFRLPL